jgi:hypothetical protein
MRLRPRPNTSLEGRVKDKVPSSCHGVRAAQLNRWPYEHPRFEEKDSESQFADTGLLLREGVSCRFPRFVYWVTKEHREAIAFHLEGLRQDGSPIPPASGKVEYVEVAA